MRMRATDFRRLALCASMSAARCSESLARSHRSFADLVLLDMTSPFGFGFLSIGRTEYFLNLGLHCYSVLSPWHQHKDAMLGKSVYCVVL
jgi:hypothetical protein